MKNLDQYTGETGARARAGGLRVRMLLDPICFISKLLANNRLILK